MYLKSKNVVHKIIFIISILGIFTIARSANAATINLRPANGSYSINNTIHLLVTVVSSTSVNAVSAKIKFPTDKEDLQDDSNNHFWRWSCSNNRADNCVSPEDLKEGSS